MCSACSHVIWMRFWLFNSVRTSHPLGDTFANRFATHLWTVQKCFGEHMTHWIMWVTHVMSIHTSACKPIAQLGWTLATLGPIDHRPPIKDHAHAILHRLLLRLSHLDSQIQISYTCSMMFSWVIPSPCWGYTFFWTPIMISSNHAFHAYTQLFSLSTLLSLTTIWNCHCGWDLSHTKSHCQWELAHMMFLHQTVIAHCQWNQCPQCSPANLSSEIITIFNIFTTYPFLVQWKHTGLLSL